MKQISHTILLMFIIINISCTNASASAAALNDNKDTAIQDKNQQEDTITEGWVKTKSETCFFRDGEKQTGWCRIANKYYYFNKKGVLQKNKIAGNKKGGYYYVDPNGIRVTDNVIQYAVKFVMKHSDSQGPPKKRLKSCYKALCKYHYQRSSSGRPGAKKMKPYAFYLFRNKKGDCYQYSSALAYIARVLGYDSRISVDNTITTHSWCEIKVNGKWKVCDCTIQMTNKETNFFLVDKKKYPSLIKIKWGTGIKCDTIYTLHVKTGKISWKKGKI